MKRHKGVTMIWIFFLCLDQVPPKNICFNLNTNIKKSYFLRWAQKTHGALDKNALIFNKCSNVTPYAMIA